MSRKILIVDDNEELAENLAELLELEGFDPFVFTSPTEALAKNDELAFDAALLDIRMPGIDGIALCSALAKTHPRATFVLMTAFTSEKRLADVAGSGASAVLKKPLPLDQLLSLLSSIEAETVLVVEDDAALRTGLVEVLVPHGYEVSAAASLAEARAVIAASQPHVAVVDMVLPDGSGAELARELVAAGVRVVLTTGYDERTVRENVSALRSDGACYLQKPFPPARLLDVLGSLPESDRR